MAESGGLENRCVREGTVGSNPTPSAVVRITTFGQFSGWREQPAWRPDRRVEVI